MFYYLSRVKLGFYIKMFVSVIPGYHSFRILGKLKSTFKVLIGKATNENLKTIKTKRNQDAKSIVCGTRYNQSLVSHWACAHWSSKSSSSRRGPSSPHMGHSSASVIYCQQIHFWPHGFLRRRCILIRKEPCIQSRLRKLTDLKYGTRPHRIGGT